MAKPFLTYDQQLEKLLTEKQLKISNPMFAKQALIEIGYFSLIGGYKVPFIDPMTRIYQNASFEDVYALFKFDQSLRELTFKYLCEVEQKIRQVISYCFCEEYGEQQSFLPSKLQSKVSKSYPNVNERELESYLKCLTLFRNVCAHNERLYCFRLRIDFPDTIIHRKLGIEKIGKQYVQGKRDYFGLVIAFRYLLSNESFKAYKANLVRLINAYCKNSNRIEKPELLSLMGFPDNWTYITRYKLHTDA